MPVGTLSSGGSEPQIPAPGRMTTSSYLVGRLAGLSTATVATLIGLLLVASWAVSYAAGGCGRGTAALVLRADPVRSRALPLARRPGRRAHRRCAVGAAAPRERGDEHLPGSRELGGTHRVLRRARSAHGESDLGCAQRTVASCLLYTSPSPRDGLLS